MWNPLVIRAILLDIEGTSVPFDFVHRDMFDHARKHMKDFLTRNCDSRQLKKICHEILQEFNKIHERKLCIELECDSQTVEDFSNLIKEMIDEDSKFRALKELEGYLWKEAFENGSLQGILFPDVRKNLATWKEKGLKIFIYSSGSVMSQKMIFSHTEEGDVSTYLDGYFDTEVGGKKDPQSYLKIASLIQEAQENILFLSDSEEEIRAANSAGLRIYLVNRDMLEEGQRDGFKIINNFDAIDLD